MYPSSTKYTLETDQLWQQIEDGRSANTDEATATAAINAYCNRRFSKQEVTCRWNIRQATYSLHLPLYPVIDAADIGIVDTQGQSYEFFLDDPNIIVLNQCVVAGRVIELTYKGGYTAATLPQPIRSAAAIMAQAQTILYPSNAAGNIAMSSNRIPTTWERGIGGQRLGGDKQPDQLEFDVEMPAKAIPYAAKQLLNPYVRIEY